MKTTLILVTAAAVVSAAPNGGIGPDVKISCADANVNYCMDSVTLVVCDSNKIGTRQHCRDDLASYPPADGVGSCWSSSPGSHDAVCEKACVVYTPKQFTIPADKCNPTTVPTGIPTAPPRSETSTEPASTTQGTATETSTGASTGTPSGTSTGASNPATSSTSDTGIMSIPEGTSLGTATVPQSTTSKLTSPISIPTGTRSPTGSDECPAPTDTHAPTGTNQPGNTTTSPTTSPTAAPTAGANANHAAGALAAAGFFAAFLL